jgi:hypothetical protein
MDNFLARRVLDPAQAAVRCQANLVGARVQPDVERVTYCDGQRRRFDDDPNSVFRRADLGSKLKEPIKIRLSSMENVFACKLEPELPPELPDRSRSFVTAESDRDRFISNNAMPASSSGRRRLTYPAWMAATSVASRELVLHVAMTRGCTDHVRDRDHAWALDEAVVEGIAQVDGRPVRVQRSHVAQGREAVVHVPPRKMQSRQRLGRGALEDLLPEIETVQAEMHMGIDESGRDRPVAEIDDGGLGWATDCWRDFGNDTVLDQDFGRPGERVARPIEKPRAYQYRPRHDDPCQATDELGCHAACALEQRSSDRAEDLRRRPGPRRNSVSRTVCALDEPVPRFQRKWQAESRCALAARHIACQPLSRSVFRPASERLPCLDRRL